MLQPRLKKSNWQMGKEKGGEELRGNVIVQDELPELDPNVPFGLRAVSFAFFFAAKFSFRVVLPLVHRLIASHLGFVR